ncbi:hypothetical protein QZH41_017562 [Actinostola sp. cb2023]|nr:hypothetical protein QZH41_017562 [Actinostola sp. cb2023]
MGACCGSLCRELDIRNLGLKFYDPKAFTESPALPLSAFILYRCLLGAVSTYILVMVALHHPTFQVVLHFSYWSIFFVALYFIFGALISICHLICKPSLNDSSDGGYHFLEHPLGDTSCALKPGEKDNDVKVSNLPRVNLLSWQHEVFWVLHSLAADSSMVALVAYFSFWFRHRVTYDGYAAMMQHILPFLSMVIDCAIHGFPVRLLHVIYANVFGFAYVVFSLVYIIIEVPDLRGEPTVYPSLEFGRQPVIYSAWLSVFILVGFFVAQTFFCLMYKVRTCLTSTGEENKP